MHLALLTLCIITVSSSESMEVEQFKHLLSEIMSDIDRMNEPVTVDITTTQGNDCTFENFVTIVNNNKGFEKVALKLNQQLIKDKYSNTFRNKCRLDDPKHTFQSLLKSFLRCIFTDRCGKLRIDP